MKDILALTVVFITITLIPALFATLFVYAAEGQAPSLEMVLRIIAGTAIFTIPLVVFTQGQTDENL